MRVNSHWSMRRRMSSMVKIRQVGPQLPVLRRPRPPNPQNNPTPLFSTVWTVSEPPICGCLNGWQRLCFLANEKQTYANVSDNCQSYYECLTTPAGKQVTVSRTCPTSFLYVEDMKKCVKEKDIPSTSSKCSTKRKRWFMLLFHTFSLHPLLQWVYRLHRRPQRTVGMHLHRCLTLCAVSSPIARANVVMNVHRSLCSTEMPSAAYRNSKFNAGGNSLTERNQ